MTRQNRGLSCSYATWAAYKANDVGFFGISFSSN